MSADKVKVSDAALKAIREGEMNEDAIAQASIFHDAASSEIYKGLHELPNVLVAAHMVTAAICLHAAEVRQAAQAIVDGLEALRLAGGRVDHG